MASLMFESNYGPDIWLKRQPSQGGQLSNITTYPQTYARPPPPHPRPLHISTWPVWCVQVWIWQECLAEMGYHGELRISPPQLAPAASWGFTIWELSYMSGPHVVDHISEQMLTHIISSRLNSFFFFFIGCIIQHLSNLKTVNNG